MRNARTRVSLATGATLVALLILAAHVRPAAADEGLPTPLPDAISGPQAQTLIDLAESYGLKCQMIETAPDGAEWFCNRQVGAVSYLANFRSDPSLVMQARVSGPLPWPDDHDMFLRDMAAPFCSSDQLDAIGSIVTKKRRPGPDPLILDSRTCLVASYYMTKPVTAQMLNAFAKIDPASPATPAPTLPATPSPTSSASPSPTASPTPIVTQQPSPTDRPGQTPAAGSNGGATADGLSAFVTSVAAPTALSLDPLVIAQSFGLAALVVLLMPFPAQLFNSTYEAHSSDVRRFFRIDKLQRAMGPLSGFWDSLVGILLFVLLSGVVYALLDPHLSLTGTGLATILGLALGILITGLLASLPLLVNSIRTRGQFRMRVLPATLLIGLGCVMISRLTGFLPGYVYGVVLGFVFARELSQVEQGRSNALAAAGMLLVALGSWLLLGFIANSSFGLVGVAGSTLLATLLVACLEGVVFGLLPFKFLPGEPLYATNRMIWGALLLIGAFCFFHILINPASGYLSSSARTPLFTMIALLVGFAALSLAFWAYFRNKPVAAD